jgi:UDP-glucose 4-epimerase
MIEGKEQKGYDVFNLGTGNGITTLEAIHSFEKVSGKKLAFTIAERRPGDVESIYANNDKAKKVFGWEPMYSLDDIMKSAWDWELKQQEKEGFI